MNDRDTTLAELSDDRIAAMEAALFADIRRERADEMQVARRKRARRRAWIVSGGVAASIVLTAALVGPSLTRDDSASISAPPAGDAESGYAPEPLAEENAADASSAAGDFADRSSGVSSSTPLVSPDDTRAVITTGSVQIRVDDVSAAAQALTRAVAQSDGFVESVSVGSHTLEPATFERGASTPSDPATQGYLTLRVPAPQMTTFLETLSEYGEVESTIVERVDVTSQQGDLTARISALDASVKRLQTLMSEATSTDSLLAAESALSERQAELESYQQQLTALASSVSLSTLHIELRSDDPRPVADPAGFADGLASGWNGFIATLNAIVVGLGFLLPWLVLLSVITAVVWVFRRVRRARRTAPDPASKEVPAHTPADS